MTEQSMKVDLCPDCAKLEKPCVPATRSTP